MADSEEKAVRVLKGLLMNETGLQTVDAIEVDGEIWLVPSWLEAPSEGWKKPARIICLSTIKHQRYPPDAAGREFLLTYPIPKSVLEGIRPPKGEYIVREDPDIRVPIPKGIH